MSVAMYLVLIVVFSQGAFAQRFISAEELGIPTGLGSRLFDIQDGNVVVLGQRAADSTIPVLRGSLDGGFRPVETGLVMPKERFETSSVAFSHGRGWVGVPNRIMVSDDFGPWKTLSVAESGRGVVITGITPLSEKNAVVTGFSHLPFRVAPVGPTPPYHDQRGVLFVVNDTVYRKLVTFERFESPISNAVQLSDGSFIVAVRTFNYLFAIVRPDGEIRFIPTPPGMNTNTIPSQIARTADGKVLTFNLGGGGVGPYIAWYDEYTGEVSWQENIPFVTGLNPMAIGPSQMLTHGDGKVGFVNGRQVSATQYVHPTTNLIMDALGSLPYGSDTVAIAFREGVTLVPLSSLIGTTSVDGSDECLIRSGSGSEVAFVLCDNGAGTRPWFVHQGMGQRVTSGVFYPGETHLRLNIAGWVPGLYVFHTVSADGVMRVEPFLVSP